MQSVFSRLTVYFEDPFWVGVWERRQGQVYEVNRTVFGAQPTDVQVYDWILRRASGLRYSCGLTEGTAVKNTNPKRMQRAVTRQLHKNGVGTKAQQALQKQHEQGKQASKKRSRAQKEAEQQRRFLLHEQKRHEKHRGH